MGDLERCVQLDKLGALNENKRFISSGRRRVVRSNEGVEVERTRLNALATVPLLSRKAGTMYLV